MRIGWIAVAGLALLAGRAQAAETLEALTARASCLIEANRIIKLSMPTQGTLARVLVRRGDRVTAGQVMAELDSEMERAMYEAARLRAASTAAIAARRSELTNAENKLARVKPLVAREISSRQQLEDAQTAVDQAVAALEQAQLDQKLAVYEAERLYAALLRRRAVSPVNGVVTKVDLHQGEYADTAVAVLTIAEIRPLRVEVYLPLAAYPLVRAGMQAEILPQEPIGSVHVAEVVTRDPLIDSASGLFQLLLLLPNTDESVPSGLRCQIRFRPQG
ncbi:MAG TPA: efflux RND transporter periplasmic adaptor subunit [Crenalkalicoccus sp.]|jgi:RND family efflux transporter MFP subunit|nr:efflux RND transporter periplasmic adaptor subunit [Crenalkalicoccus sp.]